MHGKLSISRGLRLNRIAPQLLQVIGAGVLSTVFGVMISKPKPITELDRKNNAVLGKDLCRRNSMVAADGLAQNLRRK